MNIKATMVQLTLGTILFILNWTPGAKCANLTVKTGVLLMTNEPVSFDLRRVGPAIEMGVEDAKTKYDIELELEYKTYNGICPVTTSIGYLAKLYRENDIQAVIGPACSHPMIGAARLASYFNLPIVTGVGDLVIRDPNIGAVYKTLTILSYSIINLSTSITVIFEHLEWRHTAVIFDYEHTVYETAGVHLVRDMWHNPKSFAHPLELTFDGTDFSDDDIDFILDRTMYRTRVIVLLCTAAAFRRIAYRMYLKGMANGEYAIFALELFADKIQGSYADFVQGDDKDDGLKQIYDSLLILSIRALDSPEYFTFAEKVKARSQEDYNYTYAAQEPVSYFTTAFYDSVLYLAHAYREVLDEGQDTSNGTYVAQKLWNTTYKGVTGMVAIDEFGDRIADFDVIDMNSTDPVNFRICGRYRGAAHEYVPVEEIVWPNGLPKDIPACGYHGELCIVEPDHSIIVVSVALLLGFLLAGGGGGVAFFIHRKLQREKAIDQKTWLIDPGEVQSRKGKFNDSFMSKSLLTVTTDGIKGVSEQVFCKTGFCRHHIVAVRSLLTETIPLNRSMCIEFRQLQMLSHANIAAFVGAIVEQGNNKILMEYCPRGSLQDMIHNDSVELDWDFKFSLIFDIIQGMMYLHTNSIQVHGHLSSANCVIDSKFSLKITDYGPLSLMKQERILTFDSKDDDDEEGEEGRFNWRNLLWCAPELLRQQVNGSAASQKGDIFSFAIILQELTLRAEPYDSCTMTPYDIIRQLITRKPYELRPVVPPEACSTELLKLMIICWSENADERPCFHDIEIEVKRMRRGKKHNIIDNLMDRMTDYADNLESLAADRTKAYLEEKQKVEELLFKLLPESIARQLQVGHKVIPETFDCVSIYFSDVVGFTTLCGKSTPIQVVDLLNDLYTLFDSAIDQFQVYKVETIGDAYMCVSGLPVRIGDRHAAEISNMSLVLLHAVKTFIIRHMPDERINIRIGLHSGPVVAGVVGLTMPRYCLFGDTVNTASRMESNSESLRIHMSRHTFVILDKYPGYNTQFRGEIDVKGKGKMETYWLNPMTDGNGRIFPKYKPDKPIKSDSHDSHSKTPKSKPYDDRRESTALKADRRASHAVGSDAVSSRADRRTSHAVCSDAVSSRVDRRTSHAVGSAAVSSSADRRASHMQ